MRMQTPIDRLPRSPRNLFIEAERQGFDDGYFGNTDNYIEIAERWDISVAVEYGKGFDAGKEQRRLAKK